MSANCSAENLQSIGIIIFDANYYIVESTCTYLQMDNTWGHIIGIIIIDAD